MRSLTIQIGQFQVIPQKRGNFRCQGNGKDLKGMRFSLWQREPGLWRVSANDSCGERKRIQFQATTLESAVKESVRLLLGHGLEEAEDLLVPDCFERWMQTLVCTEESLKKYHDAVVFFLRWLETHPKSVHLWRDLRLEHLQAYASYLIAQGRKPKTVRYYTQPVKRTSRWASLNWQEIFRDFAAGFKVPSSQRVHYYSEIGKPFLTLTEVGDLLFWLRDHPEGWRILPGVALQGLCAMRIREVLRLTWANVDMIRGTVTVEGVVKNPFSVRRLPLPDLAKIVLKEAPHSSDRILFEYATDDSYGGAISRFIREWNPSCRIEPKGLRRSLPSEAEIQGWGGYTLERYLGHSPRTVTQRHYLCTRENDLQEAFRDQVVSKINQQLGPLTAKWQRSGTFAKIVDLTSRKVSQAI